MIEDKIFAYIKRGFGLLSLLFFWSNYLLLFMNNNSFDFLLTQIDLVEFNNTLSTAQSLNTRQNYYSILCLTVLLVRLYINFIY